jgi:hypothetical protein
LQRRPVCPRCRLRLGEEIGSVSIAELVDEAESVIQDFICSFNESPLRGRLVAFAKESDLSDARDIASLLNVDTSTSSDKILPLLNDHTIDRLRFLMAPKRRVRRSIDGLRASLYGKTMKRLDATITFQRWLDGEDGLRDEDEVEFLS